MGFFSWKTSDTKETIWNVYSGMPVKKVHMVLPDDTVYTEDAYEGYGVFGGEDIYEVIAKLNGLNTRSEGIGLVFNDNPSGDFEICVKKGLKMPKLAHNLAKFDDIESYPLNCNTQGFWSDDDDCDDDDGYDYEECEEYDEYHYDEEEQGLEDEEDYEYEDYIEDDY